MNVLGYSYSFHFQQVLKEQQFKVTARLGAHACIRNSRINNRLKLIFIFPQISLNFKQLVVILNMSALSAFSGTIYRKIH